MPGRFRASLRSGFGSRGRERGVMSSVGVEALGHSYGSRVALDEVSFSLSGGTTALLGVNGAGKSTLLSVLAGAQRPDSGRVLLGGADPYRRGELSLSRSFGPTVTARSGPT